MAFNMIKPSNAESRAQLQAYLGYVPEDGIDFTQFVEQGGCLVGREGAVQSREDSAEIQAKISAVSQQHPRLARQWEFFTNVLADDADELPEQARNEMIFALLYAAAEADLIPDTIPEIGYTDDAAITELVLFRHADFFQHYCAAHKMEWAELKP